jgi:hypothetical protein
VKIDQLIVTCLIAGFLLSGCGGKAAIGKGGGKYSIPFDFPYKKSDLNTAETSNQDNPAQNDSDNVRVSGDLTVSAVDRKGF